ncbi:MAG: hypothetical protein MZV65_22365 [Chromatiales bacterium]|nr:hypothetical protein [Chromatiales bacterium]
MRAENRPFASVLIRDWLAYLTRTTKPIAGETERHLESAIHWLLNAQRATPDDGVPVGYFPCNENVKRGWMPSYPETTGYIIQTLVEYASRYDQPEVADSARRMALWEADVQMASGAVQGGPLCAPDRQYAAIFNTGMVLQGWTALLAIEPHERIACERTPRSRFSGRRPG